MKYLTLFFFLLFIFSPSSPSLISSSEIQLCQRRTSSFDPVLSTGEACNKKFLVALAVRNGQVRKTSLKSITIIGRVSLVVYLQI